MISMLVFNVHLCVAQELIPFKDKNDKWGFKSSITGEISVQANYDSVWNYSNGLARVFKGNYFENRFEGVFYFIDYDGNKKTKEYQKAGCFHNTIATVCNDKMKWGCINTNDEMVVDYKYSEIINWRKGAFNGYFLIVANDFGLYGLIDVKGQNVTNFYYKTI